MTWSALVLVLAAALPVQDRREVVGVPAGAVRVIVTDEVGEPLSGVHVVARPMEKERKVPGQAVLKPPGWGWDWTRVESPTDEEGRVLLEGLEPGTWRIGAGNPPGWFYHFSDPLTVEAEGTGEVRIELTRIPEDRVLHGTVAGPGGEPLAGPALVRFVWDDEGNYRETRGWTGAGGSFTLLANEPGVTGVLHAKRKKEELRSTAIDPVTAGTRGLVIELGEPRHFTLEVRDPDGGVIENAGAQFYWRLAGHPVLDQGNPRREQGEPLRWEIPNVPFKFHASAHGYERAWFGPYDSESVGSTLVVQLQPFPRVRGRVTHEGRGVQAWITGTPVDGWKKPPLDVERTLRRPGAYRITARSDEDGHFEALVRSGGTYAFEAWSHEHGEGRLGPVEVDATEGATGLAIEIERAPGHVEGTVLLPPGRSPQEIWLYAGQGYMRLAADGSYRLPNLRPGARTIGVVAGFDMPGGWRPVSTTVTGGASEDYFSMSHGPSRAPEWMTCQPAFPVEVVSGETARLDIDLASPPPCRLAGRIRIDGAPPALEPEEPSMYGEPTPKVVLDQRNNTYDYASRTDVRADGTFALGVLEPGTYRLQIELQLEGGAAWTVLDRVRLVPGDTEWSLDLVTGAMRVPASRVEGKRTTFRGMARWEGPDDLRVFVLYGASDEDTHAVTFPAVPVGPVQLVQDVERVRTVVARVVVEAGATVDLSDDSR